MLQVSMRSSDIRCTVKQQPAKMEKEHSGRMMCISSFVNLVSSIVNSITKIAVV